ncbi:hypothetical protein PU560_15455 [Georgenia sp. 10Sc9-8]|uniref:Uncharacterized protein n=1 Tax=Georgenia halotolerans TaxID=3028317 RepID=A0ABT5U0Y2_9MICO|nr:hypothetical protein [Georgenia halotolerans]
MSVSATLSLPRSVRAALWLPTVRDTTSARRAARALVDDGDTAVVRLADPVQPQVPPLVGGTPEPVEAPLYLDGSALSDALLGLAEPLETGAVLPRPGDPMGAPAARSQELIDAGEGLLVRGHGGDPARCAVLMPFAQEFGSPYERGTQVVWTVDLDLPSPAPSLLLAGVESLSHARRTVQHALTEAVDALTELDVARDRPDLADELMDVSVATLPDEHLPPGLEPRRADVLERAARLLKIVDLAAGDPGAAVTSLQVGRRAEILRGVERAARHAMCAASATRPA